MKLKMQIKAETIAAMKSKDKKKLSTLRLINTSITNKEIDLEIKGKEDLSDNEVISVLRSMVKSRENVIEIYEKVNDLDSVANEKAEIDIINTFLPILYNEEKTIAIAESAINETQSNSIKDMKKVMANIANRVDANSINKTLLAKIIKDKLTI